MLSDEGLTDGNKLKKVYEILDKEGVNVVSLQEINNLLTDYHNGTERTPIFKRFSQDDERGFTKGGRIHEIASIISGRKNSSNSEASGLGGRTEETQDERNERQEQEVEEFAKIAGVWFEVKE